MSYVWLREVLVKWSKPSVDCLVSLSDITRPLAVVYCLPDLQTMEEGAAATEDKKKFHCPAGAHRSGAV